jgi:hypothetical protein
MNIRKNLPIFLNNEITAHLFYSYPLSIILSVSNLIPWYYENFIEISGFKENNHYVILFDDVISNGTKSIYNDVLEINHLKSTVLHKENIIEYIINNINNNLYSVIFCIDRYYLRNSHIYMQHHDTREILFYGYDLNKKTLLAIDINHRVGMVKAEYYMNDIIDGYMPDNRTIWNMSFFKIDYQEEYPFNIIKFNKHLKNYIDGQYDKSNLFLSLKNPEHGSHLQEVGYHGINVYDFIFENQEKFLKKELNLRYQMFHFLYQHKLQLYKKFKYLSEKYQDLNLTLYLEGLKELTEKLDLLRSYVLKINIIDTKSFNYYTQLNEKRWHEIYSILTEVKSREKSIFDNYLENHF